MRSDLDELPDTTEADPATDADLQHLADKYFICGKIFNIDPIRFF